METQVLEQNSTWSCQTEQHDATTARDECKQSVVQISRIATSFSLYQQSHANPNRYLIAKKIAKNVRPIIPRPYASNLTSKCSPVRARPFPPWVSGRHRPGFWSSRRCWSRLRLPWCSGSFNSDCSRDCEQSDSLTFRLSTDWHEKKNHVEPWTRGERAK